MEFVSRESNAGTEDTDQGVDRVPLDIQAWKYHYFIQMDWRPKALNSLVCISLLREILVHLY